MNKLPVGLCWGTLINASLPELIQEAGRHGFPTISPTPPTYGRALEQGITAKDLRAMLKDNGVRATVIDPLMAGLPGSPPQGTHYSPRLGDQCLLLALDERNMHTTLQPGRDKDQAH